MRIEQAETKYVNESALHFMQVIEALEPEPIPIQRVVQRTQLPYDKVRRCLITAKARGWARQLPSGWSIGSRVVRVFGGI